MKKVFALLILVLVASTVEGQPPVRIKADKVTTDTLVATYMDIGSEFVGDSSFTVLTVNDSLILTADYAFVSGDGYAKLVRVSTGGVMFRVADDSLVAVGKFYPDTVYVNDFLQISRDSAWVLDDTTVSSRGILRMVNVSHGDRSGLLMLSTDDNGVNAAFGEWPVPTVELFVQSVNDLNSDLWISSGTGETEQRLVFGKLNPELKAQWSVISKADSILTFTNSQGGWVPLQLHKDTLEATIIRADTVVAARVETDTIRLDAGSGKDAVIEFSENGSVQWTVRNDADDNAFQIEDNALNKKVKVTHDTVYVVGLVVVDTLHVNDYTQTYSHIKIWGPEDQDCNGIQFWEGDSLQYRLYHNDILSDDGSRTGDLVVTDKDFNGTYLSIYKDTLGLNEASIGINIPGNVYPTIPLTVYDPDGSCTVYFAGAANNDVLLCFLDQSTPKWTMWYDQSDNEAFIINRSPDTGRRMRFVKDSTEIIGEAYIDSLIVEDNLKVTSPASFSGTTTLSGAVNVSGAQTITGSMDIGPAHAYADTLHVNRIYPADDPTTGTGLETQLHLIHNETGALTFPSLSLTQMGAGTGIGYRISGFYDVPTHNNRFRIFYGTDVLGTPSETEIFGVNNDGALRLTESITASDTTGLDDGSLFYISDTLRVKVGGKWYNLDMTAW